MSNLSCIYRWSIILILKNQRKLCYSQKYVSNLKVQLCSSRHLLCIINVIVIAIFKYNSLNIVLLINYIVYMNINSLAYIICCIFLLTRLTNMAIFIILCFQPYQHEKKLLYVCSSANQTQVNVKDANYSAESILKRWERE